MEAGKTGLIDRTTMRILERSNVNLMGIVTIDQFCKPKYFKFRIKGGMRYILFSTGTESSGVDVQVVAIAHIHNDIVGSKSDHTVPTDRGT
jgi:hypothetical protein